MRREAAGHFPADRRRHAARARFIGDVLERTRTGGEIGSKRPDTLIAAIDRVKELHQIVRADGEKSTRASNSSS